MIPRKTGLLAMGVLAAIYLLPEGDGGGDAPTITLPATRYFDNLKDQAKAGIAMVIQTLRNRGVTNKYTIAATLAVLSKESGFIPRSEVGYQNVSADRIRAIFGSRVADLSDGEIDDLKKDPQAFFNRVYKHLGGYRFRGRGLIQLTGIEDGDKSLDEHPDGLAGIDNYRVYGEALGMDLVADPDQANRLGPAAKIAAEYVRRSLVKAPAQYKQLYGFTDPNSFTSLGSAVMAVYHSVAGWGKSSAAIARDPAGGLAKTKERAPLFLALVQKSQ